MTSDDRYTCPSTAKLQSFGSCSHNLQASSTNEFMFQILTNNLGVICFFLWQFNMGDVLIGGESTGKRQYLPTFNFASVLSY